MFVKRTTIGLTISVLLIVAVQGIVSASAMVTGSNQRVSFNYNGSQIINKYSTQPLISGDGKKIAYSSESTSLLPDGKGSVVRDIATGNSIRINSSATGIVTNPIYSDMLDQISYTGRYVLFRSTAVNLIDGETLSPNKYRLYLKDIATGQVTLVNRNLTTGQVADDGSDSALTSVGVSSDGRFIAFTSNSINLVDDVSDGNPHLYMLDRVEQSMSVIDRKTDGQLGQTNSSWVPRGGMSCDGSIIAFQYPSNLIVGSTNTNHVDVYILDRRGDDPKLTNISSNAASAALGPTVSCNGDYIGFSSKGVDYDPDVSVTPAHYKVWPYVYDRVNDRFHFVAVNSNGIPATGSICGDGSVFSLGYPCLWVSDKGQAVFSAEETDMLGSSTDPMIYVRDLDSSGAEVVSRDSAGNVANSTSSVPRISADGRMISYQSSASNLVTGDTNGQTDIFISTINY